MPSDAPLNKRRTNYDLDQHFKSFLEATSLDVVATKKMPAPEGNQASVVQSADVPHKQMKAEVPYFGLFQKAETC
jgi:hypothetical protein